MDSLLVDFRDMVRALRRDPLYAADVIATLALTLGASTAVFSIVNGVLLRPLAYREAQRTQRTPMEVRLSLRPLRTLRS